MFLISPSGFIGVPTSRKNGDFKPCCKTVDANAGHDLMDTSSDVCQYKVPLNKGKPQDNTEKRLTTYGEAFILLVNSMSFKKWKMIAFKVLFMLCV